VLDLCAAPGGKTMQLAAMGAEVTALDKSAKRLARLSKNLKRTELTAQLANGDAATWTPKTPAPFVLLDAPCSATGTARRHPDVLRLKKPEDIASLVATQRALLDAAAKMLAPGGTLVYCVCSLQKEEGPDQIEAFLKAHPDFSRVSVAPDDVAGLAELVTPEGDLRTLPSHLAGKGGLDGFYAARLKRS
jgi:16S rRNA (cytosine967-C5)-methyltransferase